MPTAIDVFQRYQGAIDWPQVARDGVRYAFIKLTNGNAYAAPSGDAYAAGCRLVGIVPGGYHYALGSSTPEAQADLFAVELLRLHCLDIAPALDYEDASLPRDRAGAGRWIEHFFTRLRDRLTWVDKVLLYSSGSELTQIHAEAITVLGVRVLDWDAEYGPNDGTEHPILAYTGTAAVHQYTSVGRLPGITGPVDEDDLIADITLHAKDEADMQLTDKLNPNPAQGTVNEALNAVLFGVTGVRNAGGLAMAVDNLQRTITTQLAAISGALSADQAALLAAIQTAQQHVDVALSPDQLATVAAPITTALGALPAAVKLAIGQALIAGTHS